ncbi:hypothetical protein P7K49_032215 [Saguinus oedipus]|uniref:Uncharacterized protein n=1 Tax=Saguinus oedipus TaxID=9490 RepID=A0ABQ9TXN2_SAGOE|nr:hypothetical protein P7K49_032215 [Saguinus oedipus]
MSACENEEVFKVKKSSYSKKIVKLLKKEYKEDLEKSKIKTELNSSAENSLTAFLLVCRLLLNRERRDKRIRKAKEEKGKLQEDDDHLCKLVQEKSGEVRTKEGLLAGLPSF